MESGTAPIPGNPGTSGNFPAPAGGPRRRCPGQGCGNPATRGPNFRGSPGSRGRRNPSFLRPPGALQYSAICRPRRVVRGSPSSGAGKSSRGIDEDGQGTAPGPRSQAIHPACTKRGRFRRPGSLASGKPRILTRHQRLAGCHSGDGSQPRSLLRSCRRRGAAPKRGREPEPRGRPRPAAQRRFGSITRQDGRARRLRPAQRGAARRSGHPRQRQSGRRPGFPGGVADGKRRCGPGRYSERGIDPSPLRPQGAAQAHSGSPLLQAGNGPWRPAQSG